SCAKIYSRFSGLRITHQRQIINESDHLWSVDYGLLGPLPHYPAQGVGMRSKAYAYWLGIVAILAGVATMAFSSVRLIDIIGRAAVLGGLGAAAWASWGREPPQKVHRSAAHNGADWRRASSGEADVRPVTA